MFRFPLSFSSPKHREYYCVIDKWENLWLKHAYDCKRCHVRAMLSVRLIDRSLINYTETIAMWKVERLERRGEQANARREREKVKGFFSSSIKCLFPSSYPLQDDYCYWHLFSLENHAVTPLHVSQSVRNVTVPCLLLLLPLQHFTLLSPTCLLFPKANINIRKIIVPRVTKFHWHHHSQQFIGTY